MGRIRNKELYVAARKGTEAVQKQVITHPHYSAAPTGLRGHFVLGQVRQPPGTSTLLQSYSVQLQ